MRCENTLEIERESLLIREPGENAQRIGSAFEVKSANAHDDSNVLMK